MSATFVGLSGNVGADSKNTKRISYTLVSHICSKSKALTRADLQSSTSIFDTITLDFVPQPQFATSTQILFYYKINIKVFILLIKR